MSLIKTLVLCPDGAADEPIAEFGGKTPLAAANIPNLQKLAKEGIVGRTCHAPNGMYPGSDVCCMSLLGNNPAERHTGRAPLEAPSIGVELEAGDVAVRCNLVTIEGDVMQDFTAGHITSDEAKELISALNDSLSSDELQFHPGVSYRHLAVIKTDPDNYSAESTPPHDIVGQKIDSYLPRNGNASDRFKDLMKKSREIFAGHSVNQKRIASGKKPASQIWLWGHGPRPTLRSLSEVLGKENASGAMIGAVALVQSLGIYMGLEVPTIPGATGYTDTDYAAKGKYALDALDKHDFVFVHVEAPDEAGHEGDVKTKIKSLEEIDQNIVGPILQSSHAQSGNLRMLVCPDHPTPCAKRIHTSNKVPFIAWGNGIESQGKEFSEENAMAAEAKEVLPGHDLLPKTADADL